MPWMNIHHDVITLFIFGVVFGSFLNVVIYRLPQKKSSILWPASHCLACRKKIAWYDNLPLLSFIILKGRCRNCDKRISWQYPLVELLTAVLFCITYLFKTGQFSLALFSYHLPFVAVLIVVTFIDLRLRIIPDELSLGGLVFGLVTTGYFAELTYLQSLLGATVGFTIFFGFSWAYYRYSGKIGLGGGDIKLLAMLGAFLGVQGVFHTMFLSSVSGSIVGIAWALLSKRRNPRKHRSLLGQSIPFGPFLVLGALIYYYSGMQYMDLLGLR